MNNRSYIFPVILAVLVHAGVAGLFLWRWSEHRTLMPQRELPHIEAQMIDLESISPDTKQTPEADKRAKEAQAAEKKRQEQQRIADKQAEKQREIAAKKAAEKKAEAKKVAEEKARKAAAAKAKAERKAAEAKKARLLAEQKKEAQEKAAREKAAKEQAAKEKAAHEKAEKEKAERERQARAAKAKAAAEAKARAEAQQRARQQAQQRVADFGSYIKGLMEQYWHPPATTQKGMQATVRIRLLGSGEVDQAVIVHSSGDAAFDRSVLQAIRRASPYDKAATVNPIFFEQYLRNITIVFKAEDARW